jgi:DNA-binding CsgD family transcriptional regulator
MCATIDASATPRAASTTVLSLFRSADKGTFSLAHRAAYEQLLPHLTQAMHTYWRLRATALTASLFDLLSKHGAAAMMLLDASLRIVYANTCAERELRKLDLLSVRNGRLVVRGPPRNRTMLEAGLRAAVSGTSFTHSFESATGDRSVQLTVVRLPPPIRDAWQWLKPAVLVLLQPVRHGDTRTAASTIARNHGLSGAELRVLEQVLLARSRKAIAAELRISTNTVQSHLRSIFSKTHVSSQRELLRMVLSITARDGESEY